MLTKANVVGRGRGNVKGNGVATNENEENPKPFKVEVKVKIPSYDGIINMKMLYSCINQLEIFYSPFTGIAPIT